MMIDTGNLLPVIDLSPYLKDGEDENGKKQVIEKIGDACSEYGFFQIVNHGISMEIMSQALATSRSFFAASDEEKLKFSPLPDAPLPAGYIRQPDHSPNNNECFSTFPPSSSFNVYPINPPNFREIMDEIFINFVKIARIIERIISECLGLPPDFLKEYNDERKWDIMSNFHYFPATDKSNTGVYAHKDMNFLTFVLQDQVGGLEVLRDGNWIPITPIKGSLVVNVGDVIQVLSNDRFKSATHRVVAQQGRDRYSCAFAYMLDGSKFVEPLPQVTKEAPSRYRGFLFSEYIQLRLENLKNPPPNLEDVVTISHYAIPS